MSEVERVLRWLRRETRPLAWKIETGGESDEQALEVAKQSSAFKTLMVHELLAQTVDLEALVEWANLPEPAGLSFQQRQQEAIMRTIIRRAARCAQDREERQRAEKMKSHPLYGRF